MSETKITIAVLGASGYTGAEMLRIAATHSAMHIVALTAERRAGQDVGAVYPHLAGMGLPPMCKIEEMGWQGVDAVFCCLPHATTQEVVASLPEHLKVIDLSADFRLRDEAIYAEWYGHEHLAPALQPEAVYGLTEHYRSEIAKARIVACPGCYPTSALLPLLPIVAAGQIKVGDIVIDSKSGVTGAGRTPKEGTLYAEVAEGIHAYGIAQHRHAPEIEQELTVAAGQAITVNFTPHLVPMNRGILSTIYVRLVNGVDIAALRASLRAAYDDEAFVRLLPEGQTPATRHVRGSNHCLIGVFEDRVPGRAILVSVLDNLVKGAAGQAVQNFNVAFGLPETMGLESQPLFP
ncbi:MAG: N-acetyl-gamma-glutamyl-phosphate reductase [Alphaproteobacteria bacterium]|jgi:N-acetyl-gamma-glutamyl-phosphate reductase|nr:N-acetyl-gamma-glutamyl-phosphate reductase [Alphaproteobacteria bacterium]MDP6237912.1 N-acetyl-gamma-glutamyl-phosphate reductase [Alphaproteobacteria bacterium]MDP7172218.1 N-acetyl-gamma-glutamyl-phosphate reductase [Alphaproteobacteria bacterium]MDP7232921.1 N-acetyl-gamma-glutamyl-phosphate reductase [Alphaproteobacteria bacterium]MDP7486472.1 N-acetyl-gamma-glutamyl-phosphate reductase [Alphaproteobacteria bacterium]|tara:strand:+ start:282 stop:1328 length:1047 start_codon:yes stop_codon:yes gene_type:complete